LNKFKENLFKPEYLIIFGVLVLIIGYGVFSYYTHSGIFNGPYEITESSVFTMTLPGKPTKHMFTYGTADAPLTVTTYIYNYSNQDSGDLSSIYVQESNWEGSGDENKLDQLFADSVNRNLNQNSGGDLSKYKETIISQSAGTYMGYPSIDAKLKVEQINDYSRERFIKVGHRFYWIKSDNVGSEPTFYDKYFDTFKLKLPNSI
jgi:hypothetical protein